MMPRALLGIAVLLASARLAGAFVLGGGSADGDCRVAFGGVDPTAGNIGVVCADGDPCDVDGLADGSCRFSVSVCTAVHVAGCDPTPIDHIALAGLSLVSPALPTGDQESCGPPVTVSVPAGTALGATLLAKGGGDLRDVDYLNLCCRPPTDPLANARCALAVDPRIAGCTTARVPALARAEFDHARRLVERASTSAHPGPLVHRAERLLGKVRDRGRKLAAKDACGYSLALVATHALSTLGAQ